MPAKQSKRRTKSAPYEEACRRLSRRDPRLRAVIRKVGDCTLKTDANYFGILVRTIISQQLSTKAAISIGKRLEQVLAPDGMTAEKILATSDEAIRGCGLSGGKVKSLRDLCAKVLDETVKLAHLPNLGDDEVRESLIQIHGIGPWSADMFLMFSLGRMDVLPVGDLGLRAGVRKLYELRDMPTPAQLKEIAAPWQPYRSVATWYIWRSLGPTPQS